MALSLGWFAVKNVEIAVLVPALEGLKERVPASRWPSGFHLCDAPPPRPSLVDLLRRAATSPYASVMPAGWAFAEAPLWAEAVSKELGAVAVSFIVHGGAWSYVVFNCGERLLAMELENEAAVLSGDVSKAAAVLGVDQELFDQYRSEIERASKIFSGVDEDDFDALTAAEDAYARLRPFRGDKYHPSDEWAHLDFAKRLGRIELPGAGAGIEIDWAAPLPALSPRDIEAPLGVGERVVYERGLAEVAGVDTKDGQVLYRIRSTDGSTCSILRRCLRPLMSAADVSATFDVLRAAETEERAFSARFGRCMQLVKIGTGPALAEVVRDLTRKQAKGAALTLGEQRMHEIAVSRLAAEIACIRDVSPEAVTSELTEASLRE
jgi:hypothetical protein